MQTSETIHPDKQGISHSGIQQIPIGCVRSVKEENDSFLFECDEAAVRIYFLRPDVFRLRVYRGSSRGTETTPGVLESANQRIGVSLDSTTDRHILESEGVSLRIGVNPFSVTATHKDGSVFYTLDAVEFNAAGETVCKSSSHASDHFYGLGEKTSFLDKRGESYTMWNSDVYAPHNPEIEALYVSVPYLIHVQDTVTSSVFVDNASKSVFDMRTFDDAFLYRTNAGDMDIYVIYGPTLKDVTRTFTSLTGRMNLPPAWAFGFHQSRYSYMSQEEVLDVAKTFREKDIPADVIHLDIHYMNEYRVFTFDPVRFPNPSQMTKELGNLGFHVVPIVDPGVKKDAMYPAYREGAARDFFCKSVEGNIFFGDVWPGTSAFPDFTEDSVRAWWGNMHQFYVNHGIKGIWNDMNEPAVFNESKTMDLDIMHRNNGHPKTHGELHNLYGMMMTKATYEGMRQLLDGERPFVLTRSGYAGVGRYAAVWTGDNRSFWEHMEMAVPEVLNMGLSGIPFAGPDVGGFAHHTSPELLVRWTQMGAFFPYYRNHSALDTIRQEPWKFGPVIEDICRKYIKLRYAFMPYLYSLFEEASQTGMPMMRPLILEYPNDPNVTNLSDQFLVGEDVLVAPVFRPDARQRLVYIPEGEWVDFWNGDVVLGPKHIIANAPLDTMPLYVRAGAIIPQHPSHSYVDFEQVTELQLHVFGTGRDASTSVYEDDGKTYAFTKGAFNRLSVTSTQVDDGLEISYEYAEKGYEPTYGHRTFVFHHFPLDKTVVHGVQKGDTTSNQASWYVHEDCLYVRIPEAKDTGSFTLSWKQ